MLEQLETFLVLPKVKAITISIALSFLFLLVPLIQRRAAAKLSPGQRAAYAPIAKDILIQTWLLFGSVLVYSLSAVIRSDSSFVSGDALPFVCLLGSLAAFWNLWRAVAAIRKASAQANEHRKLRLNDVYGKSLSAYTSGLIAAAYGLIVVWVVLLAPEVVPAWLWAVNFFMTALAIRALGWSIAALAVASEYANNVKLGRTKPSPKNNSRETV